MFILSYLFIYLFIILKHQAAVAGQQNIQVSSLAQQNQIVPFNHDSIMPPLVFFFFFFGVGGSCGVGWGVLYVREFNYLGFICFCVFGFIFWLF